jgi:hypothetical protein
MKKKSPTPRNPYAPLAKKRKGGKHQPKQDKEKTQQQILNDLENESKQ